MKLGTDIEVAADILSKGGVVAIPTETVYGLAANAFDTNAILKVFEIKNRPHFDPLIVHLPNVSSISKIAECTSEENEIINKLAPGPLTFLLKKKEAIHDIVTAGSPLVAIRIPAHPIGHELLSKLPFPLVAPSANPFGYVSPSRASHVQESLGNKVDYILDGGECEWGIESTIVSFEGSGENLSLKVHRLGSFTLETLKAQTGLSLTMQLSNNSNPQAPGMLDKHYSPGCNLIAYEAGQDLSNETLIWFGKNPPHCKHLLNLSESENVEEAAKNLFEFLRKLDRLSIQKAYVKMLPEEGLGRAINDRLGRAMA